MKNQTLLIIAREYTSRVRRKSFIISTLLMPVLLIGLMALPGLVSYFSGAENKTIMVVDNTGILAQGLASSPEVKFRVADRDLEELKKDESLDAILVIPADVVDNPSGVVMYTNGSPSPQTEMYVATMLNKSIEAVKLSRYDIPELKEIIADINTQVSMRTIRIDGEEEEAVSTTASYLTGMVMAFLLYMFIMLYGQMVMTSIIEEKNNRVLEIVVSSVKPVRLMLGKVIGIGAVALTQLLIWAALIGAFTAFVMPGLISDALAGGAGTDMADMLSTLGNPWYVMGLFGVMALFLALGYLFYSGIYASIGSAVDNVQDASQLQSFAMVPVILGMVFAMTVLNDPNSQLALWLSMIPFTSPMVMVARIPFGIPAWQILISLVILAVSMVAIIWISAKIYRVGIFMYGKKPNIKELIRWAKYK